MLFEGALGGTLKSLRKSTTHTSAGKAGMDMGFKRAAVSGLGSTLGWEPGEGSAVPDCSPSLAPNHCCLVDVPEPNAL